jgi:hypothetical protein
MSYRDPYRDDEHLQTGRNLPLDSTVRTTPRRAFWSAITALAVVVVLFVVFYGINSQRETESVTAARPPATTTAPATTGQGLQDQGLQDQGSREQGGSQDQGAK